VLALINKTLRAPLNITLNQSTFDAAVKAVSDLIQQYAHDPAVVLEPETVSVCHP
tara:strand:- start:256 stop:420 length:165 start_codon:yes stop_codon:yes gene_type:complete